MRMFLNHQILERMTMDEVVWYRLMINLDIVVKSRQHFKIDREALMPILQDNDEPKTIEEALPSPNKEEWRKALEDKMESMNENQV